MPRARELNAGAALRCALRASKACTPAEFGGAVKEGSGDGQNAV